MIRTAVIVGPPGSGKSTLSLDLAQSFPGTARFAVRLLAQRLALRDDALGRDLRLADPDRFLPDPLVERLFAFFLSGVKETDLVLLEGFPISAAQLAIAERRLAECGREIEMLLHLFAPCDVLRRRIEARLVCPSCEASEASGVPVSAGLASCPGCGNALVRRGDDRASHFAARMRLYREEAKVILAGVERDRIVELRTDELTAGEVRERVHALLRTEGP